MQSACRLRQILHEIASGCLSNYEYEASYKYSDLFSPDAGGAMQPGRFPFRTDSFLAPIFGTVH